LQYNKVKTAINIKNLLDTIMVNYIVEKLVSHQPKSAKNASQAKKYHVKWEGYGDDEKTWEPKANLSQSTIKDYWKSFDTTDEKTTDKTVAEEVADDNITTKPDAEDNVEEYVVEAITGVSPKYAKSDKDAKRYTIKWEGFGDDEKTEEPAGYIRKSATERVTDFWKTKEITNDQGDNEEKTEVIISKRGRRIQKVLPVESTEPEPSKKKRKMTPRKFKKGSSPAKKQKSAPSKLEEKNEKQLINLVNKLNDRVEVLEARPTFKGDRELLVTLSKRDDLPRAVASKIRQHLKK